MAIPDEHLFQAEWNQDWILRSLIIDHYIYWRGSRVGNVERLKKFMIQHSKSTTKHEFEIYLNMYHMRGFFTDPKNPSVETGFINPIQLENIKGLMNRDYGLDIPLHEDYTIADFLYDVYTDHNESHKVHKGASHAAKTLETLFKKAFGDLVQTTIWKAGNGTDEEREYLRVGWNNGEEKHAWYLGFSTGIYLKREDEIAKILTRLPSFQLSLFPEDEEYKFKYWTLCAIDFGNSSISTAKVAAQEIALTRENTSFNILLIISVLKLLIWVEQRAIGKVSKADIVQRLQFFLQSQETPMSAKRGIQNIDAALKKAGKE